MRRTPFTIDVDSHVTHGLVTYTKSERANSGRDVGAQGSCPTDSVAAAIANGWQHAARGSFENPAMRGTRRTRAARAPARALRTPFATAHTRASQSEPSALRVRDTRATT
jgi:hypothetical protein